MTPAEVEHSLRNNLFFWAEHAPFKIKDKQGRLVTYKPNLGQRYLHAVIEKQKREKGFVRVLVPKGRQVGVSTYIQVRIAHRVITVPGTSATTLSHSSDATGKLFAIVERGLAEVDQALKPEAGDENAKQLTFPGLGSDYSALTAGSANASRGSTSQFFHGSEVHYWKDPYAIQDGALESIALAPGTEIILESTIDGPYGLFYDKVKAALAGLGDYIIAFIPWFWEDGYERDYGDEIDFRPTEEEEKIIREQICAKPFPFQTAVISRDKALRKIAWRRAKIIDLATGGGGGGVDLKAGRAKFRCIYPNHVVEAFLSSSAGLFNTEAIDTARKNFDLMDPTAARVAGVDPAGTSEKSDRSTAAVRVGRHWEESLIIPKMGAFKMAHWIINELLKKRACDKVFVDNGYGAAVVDFCAELGYGQRVQGVWFQESAVDPKFLNKRSEMFCTAAEWLNTGPVRVPDDDGVHADLASIPLDKETPHGVRYIKPKEEIKKLLGRSPDIADAFVLTFAYPVRRRDIDMGGAPIIRKADGTTASSFTRDPSTPPPSQPRRR